ncbi:hypothetical protein HELRODRAFT_159565 [Helobdella robusta]|uniref:Phosphatidylinositol N-acetylglucosaminyltransferase subunit H conserved domain-containing protein n=1 Tax=Helobdella robusta TaxID=6412 RepID=T1EP62_HELRO|nr:hypothetical protein HELRODRAFT_159565 [Helobdella robusta]ESO12970.1 hypothetical protein HELRODRAFT_159565 [Helobdella robusta]
MSHMFESKSVSGELIKVNILHHAEKLCKEIIVESPKFNTKKWFLWSLFMYLLGFYFQLHSQDVKVMVAVIILLLVIIFLKINVKVKQESLLIIASVGVQMTTKFASGRTSSMFYEAKNIHDIVINEGITMVVFQLPYLIYFYKSLTAFVTSNNNL